jgi:hypothetical protein
MPLVHGLSESRDRPPSVDSAVSHILVVLLIPEELAQLLLELFGVNCLRKSFLV